MTTDFTRRAMLGALPAFGLAGAAYAQTTGSHIAGPAAMDINATLIILAPVLAPLLLKIGMEPVHAGINVTGPAGYLPKP